MVLKNWSWLKGVVRDLGTVTLLKATITTPTMMCLGGLCNDSLD